jgi:hypothetical protein
MEVAVEPDWSRLELGRGHGFLVSNAKKPPCGRLFFYLYVQYITWRE